MILIFMRYVLNSVMSAQPYNLRAGLFKQKRLITRIEICDFSKNCEIFINSCKVIPIQCLSRHNICLIDLIIHLFLNYL